MDVEKTLIGRQWVRNRAETRRGEVMPVDDSPLFIVFARGTSLHRERHRASQLPILRNGPPGTFVIFPNGLRVSLPTDQIVTADDTPGCAHVGFGGMEFTGLEDGRLTFVRRRELYPEEQLSPARSHVMTLEPRWVASIVVDGQTCWPPADPPAGSAGDSRSRGTEQ